MPRGKRGPKRPPLKYGGWRADGHDGEYRTPGDAMDAAVNPRCNAIDEYDVSDDNTVHSYVMETGQRIVVRRHPS